MLMGLGMLAALLEEEQEAHTRVVQAVLALDEPWRETVLLRFYEDGLYGYTYLEG